MLELSSKPPIPLSHLNDLRCRHCQNFVTCGPVHVVPDTSILCGRCQTFARNIYRNDLFEALASVFRFPCRNWENHCPVSLNWNDSLQHESKCKYDGCCRLFCFHPTVSCKERRRIPLEDFSLVPVPDQLEDYIRCIICNCYLSSEPVFIQTNGKNICHRCIRSNGEPPNCLRNIAYEKLADAMLFPCIYRNKGCSVRMRFGRELAGHEYECPYGQNYVKKPKESIKKEKGVIKTHSGHVWGTITPNAQLFAPPEDSEQNVNKDLMKSLAKKQERFIRRADEIGMEFERMNSQEASRHDPYETNSQRSYGSTAPSTVEVEPGQYHNPETNSNIGSRKASWASSDLTSLSNPRLSYDRNILPTHQPVSENHAVLNLASMEIETNPLFHGGLGGNVGVSRKESFGNRDLINELKFKQDLIKRTHSFSDSLRGKPRYQPGYGPSLPE